MFESSQFLQFALVGLGATAVMDLWAIVLRWTVNAPSLDYALVARWIGHMPSGVFFHKPISSAQPVAFERPMGWLLHYIIGAGLAVAFGLIVGASWLREPALLSAALYGLVSVALPFLVLQPAFGAGVLASNTPNPTKARLGSLNAHMSFGVGLYVAAILLRPV